jgi:hypothetical protein
MGAIVPGQAIIKTFQLVLCFALLFNYVFHYDIRAKTALHCGLVISNRSRGCHCMVQDFISQ